MVINNELEIKVPEELKEMDDAKRKSMNFLVDGESCCFENEEKHLLVAIGWKKVGLFAGAMLNTNDLYKNLEKSIQTGMQTFNYSKVSDLEKEVGNKKLKGLRYQYKASDIDMVGESYVIKHGKVIYYLHYYSRVAFDDENKNTWLSVLESAKWL